MEVAKYDVNEAMIAEVVNKFKDIDLIPDNKDSYDMVMAGLKEHRDIRLAIEKRRKSNNEGANQYVKDNNAAGKKLHSLNDPYESRLKGLRSTEDDRLTAIRLEKEQVERERIEGIQAKIEDMKALAVIEPTIAASDVQHVLDVFKENASGFSNFEEFFDEASLVWDQCVAKVESALKARLEWEQEEVDRKAKAAHLETQRKAQEAAQAKIDDENRKIDEKAAALAKKERKVEKEKKAEADRKAREKFKKEAADKAKIQAEKDAKEKAEREARDKKEADEAAAAEEERQEALKPDKEKLIDFAERLRTVQKPGLNDVKADSILSNIIEELRKLLNKLYADVEEL